MAHSIDKGTTGLAPPTAELRVQACMDVMRALQWRRGKSDRDMASLWGVSVDSIKRYAAEASRRLRAEMTDPDHTAATVCVALERVIHEATEQKGGYGHRAVIEASKTWAQIAGAGAPTRFEIGALASMTEEQLERRRKELLERLAAESVKNEEPVVEVLGPDEPAPKLPAWADPAQTPIDPRASKH